MILYLRDVAVHWIKALKNHRTNYRLVLMNRSNDFWQVAIHNSIQHIDQFKQVTNDVSNT